MAILYDDGLYIISGIRALYTVPYCLNDIPSLASKMQFLFKIDNSFIIRTTILCKMKYVVCYRAHISTVVMRGDMSKTESLERKEKT